MSDEETVSDVLFRHSDDRVCRLLWQALEQGAARPSLDEQIEVMRATGGEVSLLVQDPVVEVYARWHDGGFEHISISPPWHVVDYDRCDRDALRAVIDSDAAPRPILHGKTPFASASFTLDGGPGMP